MEEFHHMGNGPSFYRVISDDVLEERRLPLPDKFVSEHGDGLSNTVRLVLSNGSSWSIGLKKSGYLFYLNGGWDRFMKHHSIDVKYFLLFKYKGNSEFGLHIFDTKAVEIHLPFGSNYSTRTIHINDDEVCEGVIHEDAEVKEEEDYASHSQITLWKCKALNETSSQSYPKKPHKVIHGHPSGKGYQQNARDKQLALVPSKGLHTKTSSRFHYVAEVKEEEEEEEEEEEDYDSQSQESLRKRKAASRHKVISGHGHGKFYKQNAKAKQLALVPSNGLGQKTYTEVKEEEEEEEDYASHSQIMCLKRKAGNKSSSQNSPRKMHKAIPGHAHGNINLVNTRAKPITSVPSNGPPLDTRSDKALRVAMMYKTKNPSFIVKLKEYNVSRTYTMRLSAKFCKEHMPHCAEFVELQDSDKYKWLVHSGSKTNGRMVRFGKGWSQFVKSKDLQIGDVCVFEVIKTNYALKVTIFSCHGRRM